MSNTKAAAAATGLLIKAAILAARWAGMARRRALSDVAGVSPGEMETELALLRDRVDKLALRILILRKNVGKHVRSPAGRAPPQRRAAQRPDAAPQRSPRRWLCSAIGRIGSSSCLRKRGRAHGRNLPRRDHHPAIVRIRRGIANHQRPSRQRLVLGQWAKRLQRREGVRILAVVGDVGGPGTPGAGSG